MRLSWKLFFLTTPLFVLFLTLFGMWMIQDSFSGSLDREIERCTTENQVFQNSFELTLHSLSEEQQAQASMARLVESFYRKKDAGEGSARVYAQDGSVLYEDNALRLEHSIAESLDDEHNVGYEIVRRDGETYAVVLAQCGNGMAVETTRNITGIFTQRSAMYGRYQAGVLLVAVLLGGLILLVLFLVMRNMQKLSRATRQFAMGRYDTRVNIRSRDEIGMLAADFNWMANTMNRQMEQLQNEVQRQEEFTAAFAHELKTPLTSIIGYADTIRQMELSPEETDMCADYIYRQGKRLQSLSYKLLELTLAGRQTVSRRPVPAPELLREVAQATGQSLGEAQLTLQLSAEDGTIYGDRDLLQSLLINLVDNARKASSPGQTIYVSGENVPEGYCITVRDEGRGMEPEELSRITEAFYMVDKSRARREGGAGLGLALCRKIVELHQAVWQMESAPGEGLKVTVRFGNPQETGRGRRRRERTERRRRSRRSGE